MSVIDSLFVGVFGIVVVFVVLFGLGLLLRLQSALVNRFTNKKPVDKHIAEAADVVPVAVSAVASVSAATSASVETPPSIRIPSPAPEPVVAPVPVVAPEPEPVPIILSHIGHAAAGKEMVTAPVSGTVIEVITTVGARVKRGDILLFLEAMKMDNGIAATRDGTVTEIFTYRGASVIAGTPLIKIQ